MACSVVVARVSSVMAAMAFYTALKSRRLARWIAEDRSVWLADGFRHEGYEKCCRRSCMLATVEQMLIRLLLVCGVCVVGVPALVFAAADARHDRAT
jgi:hypothetical protein